MDEWSWSRSLKCGFRYPLTRITSWYKPNLTYILWFLVFLHKCRSHKLLEPEHEPDIWVPAPQLWFRGCSHLVYFLKWHKMRSLFVFLFQGKHTCAKRLARLFARCFSANQSAMPCVSLAATNSIGGFRYEELRATRSTPEISCTLRCLIPHGWWKQSILSLDLSLSQWWVVPIHLVKARRSFLRWKHCLQSPFWLVGSFYGKVSVNIAVFEQGKSSCNRLFFSMVVSKAQFNGKPALLFKNLPHTAQRNFAHWPLYS